MNIISIARSENTLSSMWIDKGSGKGYFSRSPQQAEVKFAFTNFGVSYGLQSCKLWPDRCAGVNDFFESYKSGDEYDVNAITHVMHVNSLVPGVLINK